MFFRFTLLLLSLRTACSQDGDGSIYENKDEIELAATCYMKRHQEESYSFAYMLFFQYPEYLNVTAQFIPFGHNNPGRYSLFVHENADPGGDCEILGPALDIKEGETPVGKLGDLLWETGWFGLPKNAFLRYPELKLSGENGLLKHSLAFYNATANEGSMPLVACCANFSVINADEL